MGLDQTKTFLKKSSELIPPGESVRAVVVAEAKGGAWRRGIAAASTIGDAVVSAVSKEPSKETEGEVASWPTAPAFWIVLTDRQLHVFEGRMGSSKAGPATANYPYDRIQDIKYNKKLMISELNISFKDGSSIELGVAKQKVKPFEEAIASQFGG